MFASRSIKPRIDQKALLRRLGGGRESLLSRSLSKKLRAAKRVFRAKVNAHLYYKRTGIEGIDRGSVQLENGLVFKSSKLARALGDSEEMICFVSTLGGGLDSEISHLMNQNRISDAYIIDAIGSVGVESMVVQFHQDSSIKYHEEGKGVSLRFSPGYCDWPIQQQNELFKLFDPKMTGVRLQGSCHMRPRKSISGVFGLFPLSENGSTPPYNPCTNCSKVDCAARRVPGSH